MSPAKRIPKNVLLRDFVKGFICFLNENRLGWSQYIFSLRLFQTSIAIYWNFATRKAGEFPHGFPISTRNQRWSTVDSSAAWWWCGFRQGGKGHWFAWRENLQETPMSHRRIDALRGSCSKITSCEILSLQEKNITATSPPFPTVPLRVCSIVIETGRVKSPLVLLRIEIFGKSTRRFPFVGHHDFFPSRFGNLWDVWNFRAHMPPPESPSSKCTNGAQKARGTPVKTCFKNFTSPMESAYASHHSSPTRNSASSVHQLSYRIKRSRTHSDGASINWRRSLGVLKLPGWFLISWKSHEIPWNLC